MWKEKSKSFLNRQAADFHFPYFCPALKIKVVPVAVL
jgi:hypothetical protein